MAARFASRRSSTEYSQCSRATAKVLSLIRPFSTMYGDRIAMTPGRCASTSAVYAANSNQIPAGQNTSSRNSGSATVCMVQSDSAPLVRSSRGGARGRLKIFFGAAAGVGKTYTMLEGARAARTEGVDLVIGYVESHGRLETERLVNG